MYSREESKKIRQEFWISFGKDYPRKWLLYNTRIKDLSLKFKFTRQIAEVSIDIEPQDEIFRKYYFEKFQSLQRILLSEFLPEAKFEEDSLLENGKVVSRIFVRLKNVNIHNNEDWPKVKEWLAEKMDALERFFLEFEDFIKS